jgi:hypothetical protein
VNHSSLDRFSDRSLAIVGLLLFGVAVTLLAATASTRATSLAIAIGGIGAGVCGGTLVRRHIDRVDGDAGLSSD